MAVSRPLACPTCAVTYPLDERFCPRCGMPLVYAGASLADAPITERHIRARKVNPQYTEGPLVQVAGARNQAEAEFIQGMLLEEGVPSLLRRTAGFDVPDYLAAGPRDVMVPASGAPAAREVLREAEIAGDQPAHPAARPSRVLAAILLAVVLGAAIVALAIKLSG